MEQYIVIKQFIFKSKTFLKDRTLTEVDVGAESIKRLVTRGFIRNIAAASVASKASQFYEGIDGFLAPEQVNRLKKPELLDYASLIGITDVDPGLPMPALRDIVNNFVAEAGKEPESGDE